MNKLSSPRGFTLIELIGTIVVLSVIAGIIIALINPAGQIRRTKENTMYARTTEVCSAIYTCMNGQFKGDVSQCYGAASVGLKGNPTDPTSATYEWTKSSGSTGATDYVSFKGRIGTSGQDGCMLGCKITNNFADYLGEKAGTVVANISEVSKGGFDGSDCIAY
ncbi:type II secretion system protein [candidate division WWE3 bacterium]|uniref:Type II secretion system protein n=1 Tax=candidate division WWE3 bacterium TaxID=2053526 RepID=A0A955LJN6_UNCKA|nr:type II secretion system protein [candidate division WWE3 bacterium]